MPEVSDRVLILSWEYPPVIEGGLARHVRKLAEGLVRQGVEVDVLTRGAADAPEHVSAARSGREAWTCTGCRSRAGRATWTGSSPGWRR